MNFQLRIRPEAEQDMEDAAIWYEGQQLRLGQDFLDEVSQCIQRITEQPTLYPTLHRSTRRALIHRFPFGMYYRIEGDFIIVMAVMHGSRDPHRWKQRT